MRCCSLSEDILIPQRDLCLVYSVDHWIGDDNMRPISGYWSSTLVDTLVQAMRWSVATSLVAMRDALALRWQLHAGLLGEDVD